MRSFIGAMLFMAAILLATAEVNAGVYFKVGPGYSSDYETDTLPVELELGWTSGKLNFIGSPQFYARWYHGSDFRGGLLSEPFDSDDYSANFYGFGLCWGDC